MYRNDSHQTLDNYSASQKQKQTNYLRLMLRNCSFWVPLNEQNYLEVIRNCKQDSADCPWNNGKISIIKCALISCTSRPAAATTLNFSGFSLFLFVRNSNLIMSSLWVYIFIYISFVYVLFICALSYLIIIYLYLYC